MESPGMRGAGESSTWHRIPGEDIFYGFFYGKRTSFLSSSLTQTTPTNLLATFGFSGLASKIIKTDEN